MVEVIVRPGEGELDQSSLEEMFFSHAKVNRRSSVPLGVVWRPPMDVYESDDSYLVRMEIAGMREEDFLIELQGQRLSIRGFRMDPSQRRAFLQMEIRFGEFHSDVDLPGEIDEGHVRADYEDGFLHIILPKAGNSKA